MHLFRTVEPVYFLFLILIPLCSCQHRVDSVEFEYKRVSLNYSDTQGSVSFRATGAVSAQSGAQWLTIDRVVGDSVLYFSIEINKGVAKRSTLIEIKCGEAVSDILVEQSAVSGGYYRMQDSLALVAIYNECAGKDWYRVSEVPQFDGSTKRENLFPWVLTAQMTNWEGVSTNIVDGEVRVIGLDLGGAEMVGILPSEIGNLTKLQLLNIGLNDLHDDIITPISKLNELLYLDISFLDGSIIDIELDEDIFPKLGYLFLNGFNSNGNLPNWICGLNLTRLSASNANLNRESVVRVIGSMSKLELLDLSFNKFGGEIPQELYELKNLLELNLSVCGLSGDIKREIGQLSKIKTVKLAENYLNGEIPVEIEKLTYLEVLNLAENEFIKLPENITQCKRLQYVNLSFNNIEGELFEQWADLLNLNSLILLGNRLSGTVPEKLKSDKRWKNRPTAEDEIVWYPSSLILPQQTGYTINY